MRSDLAVMVVSREFHPPSCLPYPLLFLTFNGWHSVRGRYFQSMTCWAVVQCSSLPSDYAAVGQISESRTVHAHHRWPSRSGRDSETLFLANTSALGASVMRFAAHTAAARFSMAAGRTQNQDNFAPPDRVGVYGENRGPTAGKDLRTTREPMSCCYASSAQSWRRPSLPMAMIARSGWMTNDEGE